MKTRVNRVASLLVAAFVIGSSTVRGSDSGVYPAGGLRPILACLLALSLIWFGQSWNTATFGTYHRWRRIDAPTPPWAIGCAGWVLLAILVKLYGDALV